MTTPIPPSLHHADNIPFLAVQAHHKANKVYVKAKALEDELAEVLALPITEPGDRISTLQTTIAKHYRDAARNQKLARGFYEKIQANHNLTARFVQFLRGSAKDVLLVALAVKALRR